MDTRWPNCPEHPFQTLKYIAATNLWHCTYSPTGHLPEMCMYSISDEQVRGIIGEASRAIADDLAANKAL